MSPRFRLARHFYTDITCQDFLGALEGRKWVSLTVLTARLAEKITPESAVRYWQAYCPVSHGSIRKSPFPSIAVQVRRGRRTLVMKRMNALRNEGKIERKAGTAYREPMYRVAVSRKESTNGKKKSRHKKHQPRRGHATKGRD